MLKICWFFKYLERSSGISKNETKVIIFYLKKEDSAIGNYGSDMFWVLGLTKLLLNGIRYNSKTFNAKVNKKYDSIIIETYKINNYVN